MRDTYVDGEISSNDRLYYLTDANTNVTAVVGLTVGRERSPSSTLGARRREGRRRYAFPRMALPHSQKNAQMAAVSNRRWRQLTPDRLILLFLAVQALLWASQGFRWFSFNQHKGWTVLIAVGFTGAFLLLILVWLVAAPLLRLRFQYSLIRWPSDLGLRLLLGIATPHST